MIITLKNDQFSVQVSTTGAELQAITTTDGTEYLWDGNPEYWGNRATNLFPYVGRLYEKAYLLEGQRYELDIHGFVKFADTLAHEVSDTHVYLESESTPETLAQYPFPFRAGVDYRLEGSTLHVTFRVVNTGSKVMYFGLGGHPGFNVPLEDGLAFEDYKLHFEQPVKRLLVSDGCLMTEEIRPFPLNNDLLPLRHDLFDHDAIILDNPGRSVTLQSPKGRRGITLRHPHMPYLGLWHKPHTAAPFICLEPWLSLPGRVGVVEDLALQPGLAHLEPAQEYENTWSIEILK
jgi:galactose mutarotase-like enzyme